VASAIGRRLDSVLARCSVMVSIEKNEYEKRKKIEEHTREGTPVIRLFGKCQLTNQCQAEEVYLQLRHQSFHRMKEFSRCGV
jgi:hypothetical protein